MSDNLFDGMDDVVIHENPTMEVMREQAKFKAMFCLGTGVQPSEYDQLTQIEIAAFVTEQERRNKKQ